MKIKGLCLTAFSLLFAAAAQAQTVEYRGVGYLNAKTTECTDVGYTDVSFASYRYRPANVGDNDGQARLSVFFETFAVNMTLEGELTAAPEKYRGTALSAFSNNFRGIIRQRNQRPNTIDPSTEFVKMTGIIRNFGGTVRCVMVFSADMARR
ncbi:hypothetical protein [Roseovarius salis]|uniref:hypothetical protein n=1 Tax=Roseovarius salis TaxID=3376063 RepID=UPI0037C8B87F